MKKIFLEKKAQTAVETLLIVVAAVVMAIVVGAFIKSLPPQLESKANNIVNDLTS
ncbi:MAG: hypothetical protein ABIE23_01475 [archaeon]